MIRDAAVQCALQSGDLDRALTRRIDDDQPELREAAALRFLAQVADIGRGGAQGGACLDLDSDSPVVLDRDKVVPIVRLWLPLDHLKASIAKLAREFLDLCRF